jgi:hypothetical protein
MKNAIGYLLLIVLFFAGDRMGGYVLEKQALQSQFRFSRLYRGAAGADILLLGNSRGLTFYQPTIEQITGKTTCNLSYNGLPMDVAKALVLDYLDHYPPPENLLIDITTCDRENDPLLAGFLSYAHQSARLDALIRQKLPKVWWGGKVSALFRFNNEVFQRALFYRNKSDKDWLLDRAISPDLAKEVAKHSYDMDISPYLVQQLQETVAAAQAKGVRVTLVISPYFPGFQVNNLDELKLAAEKATGLPVHDYRLTLSDMGDFGDFMHPNKKGSAAYVELLQNDGFFD